MCRSIEDSSVENKAVHWKDEIKYLPVCREPIGMYTPELIQTAENMGQGGMMVHMTSNGAMYLYVGQWMETTDGLLGLIMEMKDGQISKIKRIFRFSEFIVNSYQEHSHAPHDPLIRSAYSTRKSISVNLVLSRSPHSML